MTTPGTSSSLLAKWSGTGAGRLTTVFTPPTSCLPPYSYNLQNDNCWPPSYYTGAFLDTGLGFYSPGICPSGYTSACRIFISYYQGPPEGPSETAALCCPTSYSCVTAQFYHCQLASDVWPMIEVRWQPSDIAAFETNPTVPGLRITPTSSSLALPASSLSVSPSQPTSSSGTSSSGSPATSTTDAATGGLSIGAKAAIGVVIPLVVIGLIVGVYTYFRRRRGTKVVAPELDSERRDGHETAVTSQPATTSIFAREIFKKRADSNGHSGNVGGSAGILPVEIDSVPIVDPGYGQATNVLAPPESSVTYPQAETTIASNSAPYNFPSPVSHVSPTLESPMSPIQPSSSQSEDEELHQLRARQQIVRDQKDRLQKLMALEEEEQSIQQKIRDRESQTPK